MRALLLLCSAVLLLASCHTVLGPFACTDAGCFSGLSVELEAPPAVPFRVEAFSVFGGTRYVYRCDTPGACQPIRFEDFTPFRVWFEVITDDGSERFEVVPRYEENRPNGPRCEPVCASARVRLPSDRLGP